MTLRDKFGEVYIEKGMAKECEQIANDYAIEFSEWININYFQIVGTKTWCKTLSMENEYTSKELLEIFKKEKGL